MGYSPWGRKESETTERLHFHSYIASDSLLSEPPWKPICPQAYFILFYQLHFSLDPNFSTILFVIF